MPTKYFSDQFEDETVLYVFHKHPIVMRKGLILGLFGPLLGIIPAAVKPELGFSVFFGGLAAGFILGLLIFSKDWISWHFSVYIVTDQRFIQVAQTGLFHRAVSDISLKQIQSINYSVAGFWPTVLGFGTIKMQTYIGDIDLTNIHHPGKTSNKFVSILRDEGIDANPYPAAMLNKSKGVNEEETTEIQEPNRDEYGESEEA